MTKEQYSPRTQAVSDAAEAAQNAYWDACDRGEDENLALECEMIAAAALRVAVNEVLPETSPLPIGSCGVNELIRETRMNVRLELLSILNELEEPND